MRVTLEVESGPDAGRFITVPHGTEVIVGRKSPAHFVIQGDPTISRAHFALSCVPPRCLVRDLGSTAGTLLNGEPVAQSEVKDGDIIEAGSTFLIVRIDAKAPSAPSSSRAQPPVPVGADRDGPPTEEVGAIDDESLHDRVLKQLLSRKEPLFAILDAARDPMVLVRLMECKEQYQSLYEGTKGERLAAAAPYLVALSPKSPFLETLVREGWGKSWGVYLTSQVPFAEVRKHLRRFLTVKTEEGKELLFRYYDPRVLRVFLPTCTPEELSTIFGPVASFLMEAEESCQMLRFEFDGRHLKEQETPTKLLVGS